MRIIKTEYPKKLFTRTKTCWLHPAARVQPAKCRPQVTAINNKKPARCVPVPQHWPLSLPGAPQLAWQQARLPSAAAPAPPWPAAAIAPLRETLVQWCDWCLGCKHLPEQTVDCILIFKNNDTKQGAIHVLNTAGCGSGCTSANAGGVVSPFCHHGRCRNLKDEGRREGPNHIREIRGLALTLGGLTGFGLPWNCSRCCNGGR